jgi:hypothetical protein
MAPTISALKKVEKLAALGMLTICVGRGIKKNLQKQYQGTQMTIMFCLLLNLKKLTV